MNTKQTWPHIMGDIWTVCIASLIVGGSPVMLLHQDTGQLQFGIAVTS